MHIFLNPNCDYGKGREKWKKIEQGLRSAFGDFIMEEIISPEKFNDQVEAAVQAGEYYFVAAGGDGTINLLINGLMNSSINKNKLVIGAIGLGSSNDFHKPFNPENFILNIPVKMDISKLKHHDVIRVQYKNLQNHFITSYCIINASVGITAHANAIYNSRLPFLEFIQKISVEAAILLSAIKTIFSFQNLRCKITLEKSQPQQVKLTNLGVFKNPNFAGGLCYDTIIDPDDGKLGVNLCTEMTKFEAINAMMRLYNKKFSGYLKTYSCFSNELSVASDQLFALEMDGEVVQTNHVKFQLLPKLLRCCL